MRSTIDHALYDPNKPLFQRFATIQTQFDVTLGKIRALCSDSDIETLVNGDTTMYNRLANVELTATGLISDVSRVETKYDAQSEQITELQSDLSEFIQDESGFRQTVSSTYYTQENARTDKASLQDDITDVSDNLSQNYSTTLQMQAAIEESARQIRLSVSETYATQTALAQARNATIVNDQLHYLATSAGSGVTTSTPGWSTSPQTVTETNKYLWTYHTYTYGDDHTSNTAPVITGTYGTKGDKGDTGDATPSYWLDIANSVISKKKDGTLDPTSITISAKTRSGAGNESAYAGRFKIGVRYTGRSLYSTVYTSSADESSYSYTLPSQSFDSVRVWLSKAGTTIGSIDVQTLNVVEEGADAYTVVLSNESHTFAGSETSALASSTECSVIALKGATRVAATIGTITGAPAGMSTSISNNGTTSAKFTVSVTTSMVTKNGTLSVPVTVDGKTFNMVFTYSLALKGATGENGTGIVSDTPLYYASSSGTTAPPAPTMPVTSEAITGGVWTKAIPSLTSTYPYLWTCDQVQYDDTSVGSNGYVNTAIVRDEAIKAISDRLNRAELKIEPEAIVATVTSSDFGEMVTSAIEQTATGIHLKAKYVSWDSTYSSMTQDGILTTRNGNAINKFGNVNVYTFSFSEDGISDIRKRTQIGLGTSYVTNGVAGAEFAASPYGNLLDITSVAGSSVSKHIIAGNETSGDGTFVHESFGSLGSFCANARYVNGSDVRTIFHCSYNRTGSDYQWHKASARIGDLRVLDSWDSRGPMVDISLANSSYHGGILMSPWNFKITSFNGDEDRTKDFADFGLSPRTMYMATNDSEYGYHYFTIYVTGATHSSAIIDGKYIQFASSGSSKKIKHDIKPLGDSFSPERLYGLHPKQFMYNDDVICQYEDMKGQIIPGFIAEDVDAIYPSAVIHDHKGNVKDWDERRIIPAMLALIQEQNERIKALENRFN